MDPPKYTGRKWVHTRRILDGIIFRMRTAAAKPKPTWDVHLRVAVIPAKAGIQNREFQANAINAGSFGYLLPPV